MAYKNILVHYDETKNMELTLEAAAQVAIDSDANVTGVYVIPHLNSTMYAEGAIPRDLLLEMEKTAKNAADQAGKVFDKVMKAAGVTFEWVAVRGAADDRVNRLAHFADLVVIGQTGNYKSSSMSHAIENRILLGSARPVLVIPYTEIKDKIGEKVMVAWDDSRESTRAVNDALPILEKAKVVDVVSIIKKNEKELPSVEIAHYLARHGVVAEAMSIVENEINTSDLILNHVADQGLDLIVMGAYGHSRIREMMMGGVSHNILRHMTVPVLMSH